MSFQLPYGREITVSEAEGWHSQAERDLSNAQNTLEAIKNGRMQGSYDQAFTTVRTAQQEVNKASNAITRANRLANEAKLDAERKQARTSQEEAQRVQQEAQLKASYQAAWLSAPGATLEGFEKNWPIMHDKYYREQAATQVDETKQKLLASGLYSGF